MRLIHCASIAALLLTGSLFTGVASAELFRWVDDNGVVHYGDRVPPEYVKKDRQVLNDRGIKVKDLPREMNDEELAEIRRQQAIEEAEQNKILAAQQRDRVLLSTYLSIEEIESLRNRRKELLDGQIRVTEIYLGSLRTKLAKLQNDASRFQPYNPDPSAPPIDDRLAKELSNTLNSILVYEQTLVDTQSKQTQLIAKFDNDIDRFKALKGMN